MRWFVLLGSFSLFVLFLLSSCAVQQTHRASNIDIENWLAQVNHSNKPTKWQFDGRFSAKTENENWSGSIVWQQDNDQYLINISGPLSMGSAILKGTANHAEFILSDKQSFFDDDPQTLLYQHTGLLLPVENLQYWLLGLPAPDEDIHYLKLNNDGVAGKFLQNNWEVSFKRYQSIDNHLLPDKIFLAHQDINVRLVIQNWQLNRE